VQQIHHFNCLGYLSYVGYKYNHHCIENEDTRSTFYKINCITKSTGTVDTYSFIAHDPTPDISNVSPILWFVFSTGIIRLIIVPFIKWHTYRKVTYLISPLENTNKRMGLTSTRYGMKCQGGVSVFCRPV
jgi:hypothetical protein